MPNSTVIGDGEWAQEPPPPDLKFLLKLRYCCVCIVPPAPNNVRLLLHLSRSLLIGWHAPYPPHGIITRYLFKYRPHDMPYSVPYLIVMPPTSHKYNITDLKPNSVYDIQVCNVVNAELITNCVVTLSPADYYESGCFIDSV